MSKKTAKNENGKLKVITETEIKSFDGGIKTTFAQTVATILDRRTQDDGLDVLALYRRQGLIKRIAENKVVELNKAEIKTIRNAIIAAQGIPSITCGVLDLIGEAPEGF